MISIEQFKLHLFVAIYCTNKFDFVQHYEQASQGIAAPFLRNPVEAVSYMIHTILINNSIQFTFNKPVNAKADGGRRHWAVIASLIETCKSVGVEPHAYLADVVTRIVEGHPQRRLDDLVPWAYPAMPAPKAVA